MNEDRTRVSLVTAAAGFLALIVVLIVFGLLCASPRRVEGQIKTAMWTGQISNRPAAEQWGLSAYDLLVGYINPHELRRLRSYAAAQENDLRYLMELEPPLAWSWDGDESVWWYPQDLEWSPLRRWQVECYRNDWYLKDTAGRPITDSAGKVWVNWTPYCPRGTTPGARGLKASEFYAEMLAEIALGNSWGGPWSWDDLTTPNGFQFETLADCYGSIDPGRRLADADPDRDGHAEGVDDWCSSSRVGVLTVLVRIENWAFSRRLERLFPETFVFGWNDNTDWTGPSWRRELAGGTKLENWDWRTGPSGEWTWWDWFHGLQGCGYEISEDLADPAFPDRLAGWDLSTIVSAYEPGQGAAYNARKLRLVLGTALLGDGYVSWVRTLRGPPWLDVGRPFWDPLFDIELGKPRGAYHRVRYGLWSVYYRWFENGFVRVNPNYQPLPGTPARDAVFYLYREGVVAP